MSVRGAITPRHPLPTSQTHAGYVYSSTPFPAHKEGFGLELHELRRRYGCQKSVSPQRNPFWKPVKKRICSARMFENIVKFSK